MAVEANETVSTEGEGISTMEQGSMVTMEVDCGLDDDGHVGGWGGDDYGGRVT